MSKKNKDKKKFQEQSQIKIESISKRGWKVIGLGIGIVAFGFYILSLTDSQGQNWASKLSPFLILGGYATIAIGIIFPEKKESENPVSPPLQQQS